MDILSSDHDFHLLSLRDLLEARDLYHVHLLRKANVVATAVGRHLFRRGDSSAEPAREVSGQATQKAVKEPAAKKPPRRLSDSETRTTSWPCILVFVDKWVEPSVFGAEVPYQDFIPDHIDMPDGRVVPVCVVLAERDEGPTAPVHDLIYPDNLMGGGYPLVARVQGVEHVASVGCLVSDGHTIYALTSRHVSGPPGETVYARIGGEEVAIGESSAKQLTRMAFEDVYKHWPGKDVFVNLDVGLVEIEDRNAWTAQIFGIGQIGKLADLSINNLSLRLIGCSVRAFGCASHQMRGTIHALFYRYKSVGGFEYTADFLIGAGKAPLVTQPGDSGTLWLLDAPDGQAPMPLAIQWGGHVFVEHHSSKRSTYALATCLSTVCHLLNIDVVRDWNLGQEDYWGAVGHYTIGLRAIDALDTPALKQLMTANATRISFDEADINAKNMKGLSTHDFVPLADVPDMVYKAGPYKRGGMHSPEHANHFADMDHPAEGGTLLELCEGHPENVSVEVWQKYYAEVGDDSRGLLPFRVWQIYEAMVEAARHGEVDKFVCAAGILSHYVGDACQPLHISYKFNGDPDRLVQGKNKKTGEMESQPLGLGVHALYEDAMVNRHAQDIMDGLRRGVPRSRWKSVHGGHAAAVAVVELMRETFAALTPDMIIDELVKLTGKTPSAIGDGLWAALGDPTIQIMVDGAQCLAMLWESAWAEGEGNTNIKGREAVPESALKALYIDPGFLPSHTLDTIGAVLGGAAVDHASTKPGRRDRPAPGPRSSAGSSHRRAHPSTRR